MSTWLYHVAYQHPIGHAYGPVGFVYGDVTIWRTSRIDSSEKLREVRESVAELADEQHRKSNDGIRRTGEIVIMSITLLAAPEGTCTCQ